MIAVVAGSGGAAARAVAPSGQVVVAVRDVTVGSLVPVVLSVDVDAADQVEWPALGRALGPFELRGAEPPRRVGLNGGRARETVRASVACFELGPQVLPGPLVRVSGPDSLTLRLPSVVVVVRPVLRPEDRNRDIRDIKAPVPWKRPLPAWARAVVVGVAVVVALAVLAWLARAWLRRRREAAARLPSHLRALRDLEALRRSDLLGAGRLKEYYVRLTEVLRRYLGERCGFEALDLTTAELLGLLEPSLPGELDEARRILEASDLVKFARVRPSPGAPEELLEAAVRMVERTRPAEPGEAAA
jgi:hypothetical protein